MDDILAPIPGPDGTESERAIGIPVQVIDAYQFQQFVPNASDNIRKELFSQEKCKFPGCKI